MKTYHNCRTRFGCLIWCVLLIFHFVHISDVFAQVSADDLKTTFQGTVTSMAFKDQTDQSVYLLFPTIFNNDQCLRRIIGTPSMMNWAGLFQTLYHPDRRKKSYEHAFRDIVLEEQQRKLQKGDIQSILTRIGVAADKAGYILEIIDKGAKGIDKSLVPMTGPASNLKNQLAGLGRKFNTATKSPAFDAVCIALSDLQGTLTLSETVVGAILLNALATDEAAIRIAEFKNAVATSQNDFTHDPMLLQGLEMAEINIFAAQGAMGAFAVSVNDHRNEILTTSVTLGIVLSDKAFKFNPILANYLWSAQLTYTVLKDISNQWELAQDASTLATVSTMLEGLLSADSDWKNPCLIGEYLDYKRVEDALSTPESRFKSLIDQLLGNTSIQENIDYYERCAADVDSYLNTPPEGNAEKASDITIGLIIDTSGSMKQNDPNDSRKVAAAMLLDRLSGSENIFLVDFDDKSKWLNGGNWRGWTPDQIRSAIGMLDSEGGTNIGGGLDEMHRAIESTGIPKDRIGILLLTDGIGAYNNEAGWFQENKIPVYTISFVGNDNSQLLNTIASTTGGHYSKANSASDIMNAFNQFLSELKGSSRFLMYQGEISQNEVAEESFVIDKNTSEIFTNLTWPGSTLFSLLDVSSWKDIYERVIRNAVV